jgi:protein O-mannosyl-transferase
MAYLRSGTLVADHFVYFADVWLIALVAAAIALLWKQTQGVIRFSNTAAVVIALVVLGIYTSMRASAFRDEGTLWSDTLAKNPDAWQAHARFGQLLFTQQKFAAALPHLQRAVELKPELADDRNLLGLDYCRLERFEEGIAEYQKALQLKEARPSTAQTSGVATIRTNLANALSITANNLSANRSEIPPDAIKRYEEAIAQYEKALELEPQQPAIHRNLGMLLARLGRFDEAKVHLRKTLELAPNEPAARETLDEIDARQR